MSPLVIAIDGPSGSGKGTLARGLADRYNFAVLDTGLIYRALGSRLLRLGWDFTSEDFAVQAAQGLTQEDLDNPDNRLDTVALAASRVATFSRVRAVLDQYQRDFSKAPPGGKTGAILDGRDIGTVICPDAPVKLYLVAEDTIRAKRRFEELQSRGIKGIYADVLDDIRARDKRDKERKTSPLCPAKDALILDTSGLTSKEVLSWACNIIESSPAFKARHKA